MVSCGSSGTKLEFLDFLDLDPHLLFSVNLLFPHQNTLFQRMPEKSKNLVHDSHFLALSNLYEEKYNENTKSTCEKKTVRKGGKIKL